MSLTRKIGQNFFWRGLYLASMLVSNILFARVLGATESGSFYFVINNMSLLVLIAGVCLETAIVYFGSSGKIPIGRLLLAGLVWTLVAGVAVWTVGAIFIRSSFGFTGWIWALFTASFLLINYCSALFNVYHDFKTYNIILALVNLLFVFELLAFDFFPEAIIRFFSIDESAFVDFITISYVFTVLIQGMALLIAFKLRYSTINLAWPTSFEWKRLIKYSAVSMFANLVFFLVYRVDYWFVNYFQKDDSLLGNYIQVSKLGQLFIMVPSMIATVIFPATALASQENIREELMRLCRIFFGMYVILLLLLSISGYWLFPFVFGGSFNHMYSAFAALSPGIIALSLQSLLTGWFAGNNNVRYNLYGAVLALGIIIVLNILLIPRFGINGAAIASSVGYIAYSVFGFYKFMREDDHKEKFSLLMKRSDLLWLKDSFKQIHL